MGYGAADNRGSVLSMETAEDARSVDGGTMDSEVPATCLTGGSTGGRRLPFETTARGCGARAQTLPPTASCSVPYIYFKSQTKSQC